MLKTDYEKTDVDFSVARTAISMIYYFIEIVVVLVFIGSLIVALTENGLAGIVPCISSFVIGIAVHVVYCFTVVLFELIKNVREVRNEIIASREANELNT